MHRLEEGGDGAGREACAKEKEVVEEEEEGKGASCKGGERGGD